MSASPSSPPEPTAETIAELTRLAEAALVPAEKVDRVEWWRLLQAMHPLPETVLALLASRADALAERDRLRDEVASLRAAEADLRARVVEDREF